MNSSESPSLVDLDFIAMRHKLIDVAAFLDRMDRVGQQDDFRVQAMKAALPLLLEDQSDRAKRILEAFSDLTTEPVEQAPGKGASGAVPPEKTA